MLLLGSWQYKECFGQSQSCILSKRVRCHSSDVEDTVSCNVLVLPMPVHMLQVLLLMNHIDLNGTTHGSKQMYICFCHNLVFTCLILPTMQRITAS